MSLPRSRAFYGVLALLALVVIVAANAHLVVIAGASQPGCVEHLRPGETGRTQPGFSASGSSC